MSLLRQRHGRSAPQSFPKHHSRRANSPQSRREVLGIAIAAVLIGLVLVIPAEAKPPNLVFILADDLAWSDVGCYGNRVHQTPNIDRLAEEGMRFTQAYAPAPICSASRAAILTGKFPARLKFEFVTKGQPGRQELEVPLQSPPYPMNLPLKEITLGEALKAAGYDTGFFGKWHVNRHYQGYLGWSPTHGPLQQGFQKGDPDFGSHPYAYRSNRALKNQTVPEGQFPDDRLADKAIDFLKQPRNRPFFLYLSQYYVHTPVHSRCDWLIEKYQSRLPKEAKPSRAAYGAMVETLDHLVGRVLKAIDQAGLKENTLVVLTSDNGGHPEHTSNAPLRGSKWNLYEGGIRVPMIVRWPGQVKAGSECREVVHGCDLFPTFTAAAGSESLIGGRDGVSLLPLFQKPNAELERREPLIFHFPFYHPERNFHECPAKIGVGDFETSQTRPQSAIRDGDWKLLQFYEDDRVELYNLKTDLAEQRNLAKEKPETADRLRRNLNDRLDRMKARFPQPISAR